MLAEMQSREIGQTDNEMFLSKVKEVWNQVIRKNREEKVKDDFEIPGLGYFRKTRR